VVERAVGAECEDGSWEQGEYVTVYLADDAKDGIFARDVVAV